MIYQSLNCKARFNLLKITSKLCKRYYVKLCKRYYVNVEEIFMKILTKTKNQGN